LTGARRALAVHTNETEATRLAGLLAALGYEADIATCADMALERLIASPDYELAVIDLVVAEPTSGEIISRIRRDARSGRIPVLVVTDREWLPRADAVARQHRLTSAYVRPIHVDAMRYGLEHLGREAADAAPIPAAERLDKAKASIDWINAILAQPRHVLPVGTLEPVLSRAAWNPALAPGAVQALAQIGVPGAQRTLVDLASRDGTDVAKRRAAAEAFAHNVERFGTLLSAGEILQQYDRYNASEHQPANVQAVLALVLDAMEARAEIAPRAGASPPAS
jgi:CheY-like chemotaxis protein